MDRSVRNWMFVSIAIFLAEIGRLLGGHFKIKFVEWGLDGIALALILIMIVRFLLYKWRK